MTMEWKQGRLCREWLTMSSLVLIKGKVIGLPQAAALGERQEQLPSVWGNPPPIQIHQVKIWTPLQQCQRADASLLKEKRVKCSRPVVLNL